MCCSITRQPEKWSNQIVPCEIIIETASNFTLEVIPILQNATNSMDQTVFEQKYVLALAWYLFEYLYYLSQFPTVNLQR